MNPVTTLELHDAVDAAAAEGDYWVALRCAADILATEPADHRARIKLALSLAALGRTDEAVRALRVGGHDLVARGFILTALGMAKDALSFEPDDEDVWRLLEEIHRVSVPGQRPRVPPPTPPSIPVADRPFHAIADRETLLEQASALADTPPPLEAAEPGPFALPLFADIGWLAFRTTIAEIELQKLGAGRDVVRQGEQGDALFVVLRGEVEVVRNDRVVAVLGAGSFFGELSLFLHRPRSATVRTKQPSEIFVLSRPTVERLAERHPELSDDLAEFARRRLLANVVATSPIFSPFRGREKRDLLESFQTQLVSAGETIITEGSSPAGLFVVVEGQVQVRKSVEEAEEIVVAHLGPGQVFGEISLLQRDQATATVAATESTMLLLLPREDFAGLVASHPKARDYLAGLSEDRLQELRSAVEVSDQVLDADDLVLI